MTIICAQKRGKETWIGSDSRWLSNNYIMPVSARKWAELDGWHIGVAGWARLIQLLEARPPNEGDWKAYTPVAVADVIRKTMDDDKWAPYPQESRAGPQLYACQAIIVSPALEVFELLESGSLCPMGNEFSAMGSGCEFALGAAYALKEENPDLRMLTAIRAASTYDTACGGTPFLLRLTQGDFLTDPHCDHRLVPRHDRKADREV